MTEIQDYPFSYPPLSNFQAHSTWRYFQYLPAASFRKQFSSFIQSLLPQTSRNTANEEVLGESLFWLSWLEVARSWKELYIKWVRICLLLLYGWSPKSYFHPSQSCACPREFFCFCFAPHSPHANLQSTFEAQKSSLPPGWAYLLFEKQKSEARLGIQSNLGSPLNLDL